MARIEEGAIEVDKDGHDQLGKAWAMVLYVC
jgi:hypothetical protein